MSAEQGGVVPKNTSMKDENEWMKNTLFQDLTSEHEKNFKIIRFYMGTLKSKVQFSHLNVFLLLLLRDAVLVEHFDKRAHQISA